MKAQSPLSLHDFYLLSVLIPPPGKKPGDGKESRAQQPSAVFSIRLNHRQAHTQVLAAISEVEGVYAIEET